MQDDTPNGETANAGDVKNNVSAPSAPIVDNAAAIAEAEQKTKLSIEQRANQIANAKIAEARKQLEEEAERVKNEEKEEFKTLYEKEKEKNERIETERAETEKRTQLETDSQEVFAKFSPDVVEVAKTAGLSLEDTTETAKAALTEKLTAIAGKVKSPGVTGNNPAPTPDQSNLRSDEVLTSIKYGNKDARREYIKQSPSIQAVKKTLQEQVGYSQA